MRSSLSIEVWLTEEELAHRYTEALSRGHLPEMFFYWSSLSVRAWLALCGKGRYKNYLRSKRIVRRAAAEVARTLSSRPVQVLSLGSGQGDKDLVILKALRRSGMSPRYLAVDSSQALLEMALRTARAFPARGLKADLTDRRLSGLPHEAPARLVLVLGNTLGFDPPALARAAASLMGKGDRLLVDGEILGPATMEGYDNPVNRRFALSSLHAAGIGKDDGELRFDLRPDPLREGLFRLEKDFRLRRSRTVSIGGEQLRLPRRLKLSVSYKYTPEGLLRVLSSAGLRPEKVFAGENFQMILARRTAKRGGH